MYCFYNNKYLLFMMYDDRKINEINGFIMIILLFISCIQLRVCYLEEMMASHLFLYVDQEEYNERYLFVDL